MIVWLNGTFGVGKTTTSGALAASVESLRPFDPEQVGSLVAHYLADQPVTDFQHYPSWRRLVPVVVDEIARVTGQDLVAAQSVLVEQYWREIAAGLAGLGHDVFHVLLDADADRLHARIDVDEVEPERIRPWRHEHVDAYQTARPWLVDAADLVVDTVALDAAATAQHIQAAVAARL